MKTERQSSGPSSSTPSYVRTSINASPGKYRLWLARVVFFIFKSRRFASLFLPRQYIQTSGAGTGVNEKRLADRNAANMDDQATLNSEWNSLQRIQSPALYQTRQFLEIFYQNMLGSGSWEDCLRTPEEKSKRLEQLDAYFKKSGQEHGFTDLKSEVFLRHLLHAKKHMDKAVFFARLMALPASQKIFVQDILNKIITNALVHHSIHGHPRDLVSREQIELLEFIESNDMVRKEFIQSGPHPVTESWALVQNRGFKTIASCINAQAEEDIAEVTRLYVILNCFHWMCQK